MEKQADRRLARIWQMLQTDDLTGLENQVARLEPILEDGPPKQILEALKNHDLQEARQLLGAYLAPEPPPPTESQTESEPDPQAALTSARLQLRTTENMVAELALRKAQIEKQIHHFQYLVYQKVGNLLQTLLRRKAELSADTPVARQLEEQLRVYRHAARGFEDEAPQKLPTEAREKLEHAFSESVRRCHPQLVAPHLREMAETLFEELHEGYRNHDLELVEDILKTAQADDWFIPLSEHLTDLGEIRPAQQHLEQLQQQLVQALSELEQLPAYRDALRAQNDSLYFHEMEARLRNELDNLPPESPPASE